jgi:amidophosphoribosyltransferase
MVAYEKDNAAICKDLGADRVVFQSLDDLTEACSDVGTPASADIPRTFEVGVFCGKYVTPIPVGYFDHLEDVRGKKARSKQLPI